MSFTNTINNSTSVKSNENTTNSQKKTIEQLNSTSRIFCEAVNQIVKAYLANYKTNPYQTISINFAQKVIKKTKISFSQLVVTLVYLNRYYQSIVKNNQPIPGEKEAIIPTLSNVVLLCIIQAERYITDIPHKLSWWANVCAGQTKTIDINKWQLDFFKTVNYKLYVHPEKDFNIFKFQIKRLAARLFSNSIHVPPQFRRSINLGSQTNITTNPSQSSSTSIPSQPNIISSSSYSSQQRQQPQPQRNVLSPLYSGNSNLVGQSNQTNRILSSPIATVNTLSSNHTQSTQRQINNNNLNVPILNIVNANLTTSPEIIVDGVSSTINQMRSPSSIYSQHSIPLDTRPQLPLPVQNPNHLMVQANNHRSPLKSMTTTSTTSSSSNYSQSSLLLMNQNIHSSPLQDNTMTAMTNLVSSPIDISRSEDNIQTQNNQYSNSNSNENGQKRKRSFYPVSSEMNYYFLKASQSLKRAKITMTISPDELNYQYQPNTPTSRPVDENNTIGNGNKSSSSGIGNPSQPSHRFRGDEQNFPVLDNKGKKEVVGSSTSTFSFPQISEVSFSRAVENSFLNHIETIPSSSTSQPENTLENNTTSVNREDIIVSSLLLNSSNNSTLIPVSPPLTPK